MTTMILFQTKIQLKKPNWKENLTPFTQGKITVWYRCSNDGSVGREGVIVWYNCGISAVGNGFGDEQ